MGCQRRFNRKPILFSIAEDLRRGKTTEVNYINGEIVRMAAGLGTKAPYNEHVVELIHEVETGVRHYTQDEVVESFTRLVEVA